MSKIDDDERKARELLEGIKKLSPDVEPMTEGEERFLLDVLRGELNDVPDRFTGSAIVNVSPNTPEQQKVIDEINAELEARDTATRREE